MAKVLILGNADTPARGFNRGESGYFTHTFKFIIVDIGFLGQHLLAQFSHPVYLGGIGIKNKIRVRMGNESSFFVH